MAQVVGPPASGRGTIYFELERLEVSGARLELRGRWYGVRGRRFMRPTLTLRTAAGPSRLLADLDQKPWAAQDAELWLAVFPWELEGQDVSDLELSVAPDIAVGLPAPGGKAARTLIPSERESFVLAKSEPTDVDAVSRRLAEEQHRNQLLRAQVDELREAHVQTTAAVARRDAALAALDVAERERNQAVEELERARAESDEAVALARSEREEAIEACELARSETAQARSERSAAIRAAERATSERAAALRSAEQAGLERDDAVRAAEETRTEATRVRLERDETAAALEQAHRERDGAARAAGVAVRERDKAMKDRDKTLRERDKALVATEQARTEAARAPAVGAAAPRTSTSRRTYRVASVGLWAGRVSALIVLVAILVALAVIVKVL